MPTRRCAVSRVLVVLVLSSITQSAFAQCTNPWIGNQGGFDQQVTTVASWDPDGAGPAPARFVAAGNFLTVGATLVNGIAWSPGTAGPWSGFGAGANANVRALAPMPNGDLIAAGNFTTMGGVAMNHIACWNGTSWQSLGSGLTGSPSFAASTLLLPNGDLIVGGRFTSAGGVPASNIARWDGAAWHPLGAGIGAASATAPVGVLALALGPNGDVYAGGIFATAGGAPAACIARWDGAAWHPLGLGITTSVSSMSVLANGDVVASGLILFAGGALVSGIARWDGAAWHPLGQGVGGPAFATFALPNGDLLVGGDFDTAGAVTANCVARWNGSTWSSFGIGLGGPFPYVMCVAQLPGGDVVFAGDFNTSGGLFTGRLARLTTTCPATATVVGAGCPGPAGTNTLAAASLPWLGSTFRAHASGLAMPSIAVAVTGLSQITVPLATLLAQGAPGCDLRVSLDVIGLLLPNAGAVESQLPLPNAPSLLGATFHHQLIPLELDAMGNIAAVTATNALTLTIGAF